MLLNQISQRINRKLPSKRLGRGTGSGVGGHTVGRGQKGQKSRSGHKSTLFFEGGNVAYYRRMPKYRGFKTVKVEYQAINIADLDKVFGNGDTVDLDSLRTKGFIPKRVNHVKILGYGDLTKKLNIVGVSVSESAKEKILSKEGTIK